jgi:hypothetical protein
MAAMIDNSILYAPKNIFELELKHFKDYENYIFIILQFHSILVIYGEQLKRTSSLQ